ncbi:MAG: YebC/PmpR family DNA-binding transcriptional regulator [Candidatus Marinimicrobia bacterium]|nr:YebC/PmpR family DNA-binding transcriptional regulator [Candidatus Neomarinimicrobiota bacterium]MCF7827446.1 YebC/PmpR family DNA-binding transcriptional regulator [Candidatus Neomarinimicrobiota bacterium]MCF7882321.1 YebC/PmpR family DNA-binding transcriptional regulator [Candidatus Neomarinimicrobiota bacterium]
MSGHSKWSTIKRKKEKEDQKRGKIFTKLIKEITVAARIGGGDPETNPRLRQAIDDATDENMPKDNIEKAILRGTGDLPGVSYEDMTYEGYGPNGTALFIECTTDNKNRTVSEIRHLLDKHDGSLGESGSVSWVFDRKGVVYISKEGNTEDDLMLAALENGAEDISEEEEFFEVTCPMEEFHNLKTGIEDAGFDVQESELQQIPKNTVDVTGTEAKKLMRLLEALEDHDDVQNVWSNADIDEDSLAEADAS